jgi:hypothetical protein
MIASLVAYAMTAILFSFASYGLYWTLFKSNGEEPELAITSFVLSMLFFSAAYGCAWIGGI